MTDESTDKLKDYLVSADSSFYWAKPVTNPQASYQVLWYKFPFREASESSKKSCRVDLFTPGMIHLPRIPSDKIFYSDSNIPVMPFFPVALHKIQAWKAHLASTKPWAATKQRNDVNDINDLLNVAMTMDEHLHDQTWLEQWFLDEAVEGVRQYIVEHPDAAPGWAKLGFGG